MLQSKQLSDISLFPPTGLLLLRVDESIVPTGESAKCLCLCLSTRSLVAAVNNSVTLLLVLADVSIYCMFNVSAKLYNQIGGHC